MLVHICYILTYADSHLHTCTYICRIIHNDTIIKTDAVTNDTMIKTQEDFSNNIYLSLYCKGSKRLCGVLLWEGAGDRTKTVIFWPLTLMAVTLCLSRSLVLLNRRPRGSLCCVMAFFIASYQHLLRTSAHQGPRPLRPGVAFSTTPRLHWNSNSLAGTQLPQLSSWLSYIIVQRLHDRPLDLWNRMFVIKLK